MQDDLRRQVQWLADIELIRQLKYRYCSLCDDHYDAPRLAMLFTEEAVWDGGPMGTHQGRDAIRRFFEGSSARVPFALHMVTNPLIEVDGDTATGKWYLWEPLVYALPGGEQAWWMSAHYDDRYRRAPAGWQFERVSIAMKLLAPYEAGWGPSRITDVYAAIRARQAGAA